MKRNIIYTFIFISILVSACIKDQTNLTLKEISPILIDTAGLAKSFSLFQMDTLKVAPTVSQEGLSTKNLKYEWGINADGYKRIAGTEKDLVSKITEGPGAYVLIYTVTDSITNIQAFFTWTLTISSPFGAGLVVAHTHDDVTSDLGLLMTKNFNPVFADTAKRIFPNLYSAANSHKIEGIVKSIGYMRFRTDRIMTAVTDKAMIRVDPLSYKYAVQDHSLFLIPLTKISPNLIQSIQPTNQHEYIVNNGKVHSRFGTERFFGYHLLADKRDYFTTKFCGLQSPGIQTAAGVLYDEKNNRFLLAPGMLSNDGPITAFPEVDSGNSAFDPANMGNMECLHLEEGQNSRILAIMKNKDTQKYGVYQLIVAPLSGKMGHSLHDITNNPEMTNSKFYTCSSSENVLFYATDTKVYASSLLFGGGTSPALRYTTQNGEKITGMQIHRMPGFMFLPNLSKPTDYSAKINVASTNRLVILSTYNETTKEGKIITLPIETLGVGGLVVDPAYIGTHGGFGKITAFNFHDQ